MAKVIGPLFSLAASGTYRDEFVFRQTVNGPVVSNLPRQIGSRSPSQIAQAEAVKSMAAAWTALPTLQKNAWTACAAQTSKTGYALFWAEWFFQEVVTPDLPLIPCA